MKHDEDYDLLEELLMARGPGGQEEEVRDICRRALAPVCDELWTDAAGNLIGLVRAGAESPTGARPAIRIMAHMDEIAMLVKRVEPDGSLRVTALGGAFPVNFGVCPVDILADQGALPGVLSFGSMHGTSESPQGADVLSGNVQWKDVHIVTRLTPEQLLAHGVQAGTRVVLSRHWRRPWAVNDAIAAHFLDDRAPLVATLKTARLVSEARSRLACDCYFVLTTMEEESNAGALYAANHLPGDISLAVEVGPVMQEYGTRLARDPIINTGDHKGYYSRSVTLALQRAVQACGLDPQLALLVDFASDASAVMSAGVSGKAGCIAIPTENTHGLEIILDGAIDACARAMTRYLLDARGD